MQDSATSRLRSLVAEVPCKAQVTPTMRDANLRWRWRFRIVDRSRGGRGRGRSHVAVPEIVLTQFCTRLVAFAAL